MLEITKKTATECARYVTETLKPVLKLHDWNFVWNFKQMERMQEGEVQLGQAHVDYNRLQVVVFIDTFRHEDDFTEFVDTLRHELLHATHFMWSRAINTFREMVPEGYEAIASAYWSDACEEHVAYMGRILDNMGYSVDVLADTLAEAIAKKPVSE